MINFGIVFQGRVMLEEMILSIPLKKQYFTLYHS